MSITFSTLTLDPPDVINFDKRAFAMTNITESFSSPLADNDVVLLFSKAGVPMQGSAVLWDGGSTAQSKWEDFKSLEGTVSTLTVNGQAFTNVALLFVDHPNYQGTSKGANLTFTVNFRKIAE